MVAMRRPRFEENREFYAAVGRRIAKARAGAVTQEALAKKTSLTRTSIINIEKGRQQILLHTLVGIAQVLHVPLTDLIPDSDSLETLLHDKTRKGVAWVRSSTSDLKR